MLVNNKRKLVFIHIPKNAGTTFKSVLYSTHGDVEWKRPFTDEKKYTHSPLKSFYASFPESKDYKVITIIRNPYERALSWYSYYRTPTYYNRHPQMRALHYAQQPFLEFLKWYNRSFKSKWEMLPQVWWYTHKNKLHSDYQIRFENLEQDINKVSNELDMDIIKIPHNNKSSESLTVGDVYCDESISIINEWYKEDFKKLDYLLW
jgi:hypothetical protein